MGELEKQTGDLELYRWDDPTAIARAERELVQKTLADAISDIHVAAHEATVKTAERIISKTSGIQNGKLYEVAAAQGDALMEQAASIYQELALDAASEMIGHAKYRLSDR